MKISNMSLLSCLLITALLSTPVNAQTEDNIEKLVKNNSIEVCECFKQVDYIDDFSDFDIKFDQCLQASTNDSALKQDEHIFEQYTHSMHEYQMQSCDAYAARVDYVLQRPEPKLSDPIYNNQDQYKEIAESIVGEYSMSFGNPSPLSSITNSTQSFLSVILIVKTPPLLIFLKPCLIAFSIKGWLSIGGILIKSRSKFSS